MITKERSLPATLKAKSERRGRLLSDQQNAEELKVVEREISNLTSEHQDVEAQLQQPGVRGPDPGLSAWQRSKVDC